MTYVATFGQPTLGSDPSKVSLYPFGAMAQEKKDLLSQIADIAGKVSDTVQVIKGQPTRFTPQTQGVGYGSSANQAPGSNQNTFGATPIWSNPLFIAGAALVAVVLIMKRG